MIINFYIVLVLVTFISVVNSFPESSKLSTTKKSQSKSISGRSGGSFENCYSKGIVHQHGSNLTRSDDPCERCFCYKGTILCWNINCPQSLDRKGCKEIKVKDLCCPILECPLEGKDAVFKDIIGRQPRTTPDETSEPSITPKEITCKYGREKYKPGQRVTINPLKPCQRCMCSNEGKVKCELASTCKDESLIKELKKQSNLISKDSDHKKESENVSSFSTRTIPDAILKRVQNLLHKVSTHNLTSINPNDLN
ncbi:chordin-like [Panonychus citri]|uniref:chordin-like n=1 Tax=Panonychus citri TaxID=50023 RepID=UPI0023070573|nr:chordin-like [Panonychus citri]